MNNVTTTIATQLAELNEHLVAIIDCLPCGDGGEDSCSEEIAKIRQAISCNNKWIVKNYRGSIRGYRNKS